MKKLIRNITAGGIVLLTAALSYLLYFSPHHAGYEPQPIGIDAIAQTSPKTTIADSYAETIAGKIITLKKLNPSFFFDYYTNFSEDVRKNLEFPEKITYGYMEADLTYKLNLMNEGRLISYCIFDNNLHRLIGAVAIRDIDLAERGQMSMWLNEKYRGGGRMQEALYLISKAYFATHKDINRYNAHVRLWNLASQRVMEKFGFKKIDDFIEDGKVTRYIYQLDRKTIENLKNKFEN